MADTTDIPDSISAWTIEAVIDLEPNLHDWTKTEPHCGSVSMHALISNDKKLAIGVVGIGWK